MILCSKKERIYGEAMRWYHVLGCMVLCVFLGGLIVWCLTRSAETASPSEQMNTESSSAGASSTDLSDDIDLWAASVVKLEVFDSKDNRIGTGSGFAAFEEPILITARHVVVNMEYMIATKEDGTTFRIDHVIEDDEASDLVLCELPEDAGVKALPLSTVEPKRGAGVIAIGSQFGVNNLVTMGNVCGSWSSEKATWILFTAPVSGGSSGGPLLNERGEVVGIVTGSYEKGQNLNLAAPVSKVQALYDKGN